MERQTLAAILTGGRAAEKGLAHTKPRQKFKFFTTGIDNPVDRQLYNRANDVLADDCQTPANCYATGSDIPVTMLAAPGPTVGTPPVQQQGKTRFMYLLHPRANRRRMPLIALAAWSLAIIGCNPAKHGMGAVSGQVTLDKSPVAGAAVTFMPQAGGRPAYGVTDAEGHYQLTTFKNNDGAPLGSYRVIVSKTEAPGATADQFGLAGPATEPGAKPRRLLPARYASPDTSGLTYEVKSGANVFDLELTEAE